MAENSFNKIKKDLEKTDKIKKNVILYKDFMAKELPPNKWVVDDLIPEGMTILSSVPGHFKTYILLALSKQISKGEKGFGHFETEERNVLFINEEMSEKSMQDRLKTLDGDVGNIYFTNLLGIKLDDMAVLLEICKEKEITLVIFDSLTRIHNLTENDASDVKKIFEAILMLLRESISVVMTHHHRKTPLFGARSGSDEMRGSTDLLAQIDCHIAIDTVSRDKTYMVIRQLKLRQAENIEDFKLNIERNREENKVSFTYKGRFSEEDALNIKIEENKKAILVVITETPGITKQGIMKQTAGKVGQMAVSATIRELEKKEVIYCKTQKPKTYYIKEEIEALL